jgi:outer membrane lipoprotein-sorting protein
VKLPQSCQPENKADINSVDGILEQLHKQTQKLNSYQCRIEYLANQPLLESQTLRTGILYYLKSGGKSQFRINFDMLKQDQEKEQKYLDQWIFDSQYLTHIDYQTKSVKLYQIAEQNEPNNPANPFELISQSFPLIGFTKAEDLKKQFDIKLIEQKSNEPNDFVGLHLKVKAGSIYKDDYTAIDFWMDKKLMLPSKISAASTEGDIKQIQFLQPKVNEKIDEKVFEFRIPDGFGKPDAWSRNVSATTGIGVDGRICQGGAGTGHKDSLHCLHRISRETLGNNHGCLGFGNGSLLLDLDQGFFLLWALDFQCC